MSDDDFLSRWSRRKRSEKDEPAEAVEEVEVAPEPEVDETEEAALERLGLPDPDMLEKGDDFSGFLKKGVPEMLRRRALRRLWRTDPVLANIDGLVEYGENYADPALVPDVLATAYKVGEGMVRKVLASVEGDEAEDEAEILAESEATTPQPKKEVVAEPDVAAEMQVEQQPTSTDDDTEVPESQPLRPRRMRFSST